jgi:hypothetical protein
MERDGAELRRWTNGDADLPLAHVPGEGPVTLEVLTTCVHRYRLDSVAAPTRLAA